ncbi:MAG: tripartite tricarboxylate transporter TctB family protein [Hyphomicrobiaceae bacterium]
MLYRVQGFMYLLLGGVSLAEGWHITQTAREAANFDAIGPDRYLIALGVLLLATGLWMALRPQSAEEAQPSYWSPATRTNLMVCIAMLAAFALAMPYIGFTLGCFVFLAVLFHQLSDWSWVRSAAASALTSAFFYVGLIRLADVPLPSGMVSL